MTFSKSINNSALLIIERVITIGLAFITGVFLARVAGPDVFGEYAYILSFAGLFAPLCFMGLNNITTKYVVKYPRNSHHYVKSALLIRGMGAVFSIILGLFLINLLNEKASLNSQILTLLILQSTQLFYVFEYYFLANNQVLPTLKIRLTVLLCSGLLKIWVVFNGANITTLVGIHGIAYLIIALGYLWLYRSQKAQLNIKHKVKAHTLFAFFHRGKWLLLSGIAAVIYLKIDQVMLAYYYDTKEVGIYAAAARLSEFWYVFPVLIANAFSQQLFLKHKNSTDEFNNFIASFLRILITAAVIIALLTFLLSELLIDWIYGAAFSSSAVILNIHIFATIFIFQRAIFSKWLIIKGLYKYSLWTQGAGAIINVSLNLIFIPKWGGIGAAWATLISYIFASYLSLFIPRATRPFAIQMTVAMLVWPLQIPQTIKLLWAGRN
ncbi:flippase [Colwelliaceae bacterium 6471]